MWRAVPGEFAHIALFIVPHPHCTERSAVASVRVPNEPCYKDSPGL